LRLPRLAADTADTVVIATIAGVDVAEATVEDPRGGTIARVDRRGPPTGVSLFYSLEEAKRSLGSSIRHFLAKNDLAGTPVGRWCTLLKSVNLKTLASTDIF
jgi:hypothetical protein